MIQYQARQKVGLEYGVYVGLKNQSYFLKQTLSKKTVWRYQNKNIPFYLTLAPQKSFVNIITILQCFSYKKRNKSSFYKVVHGQRTQMYGWSFICIQF